MGRGAIIVNAPVMHELMHVVRQIVRAQGWPLPVLTQFTDQACSQVRHRLFRVRRRNIVGHANTQSARYLGRIDAFDVLEVSEQTEI